MIEENKILQREKEEQSKIIIALTQEKDILENEKILNNRLVQQLNDKIKVLHLIMIEIEVGNCKFKV